MEKNIEDYVLSLPFESLNIEESDIKLLNSAGYHTMSELLPLSCEKIKDLDKKGITFDIYSRDISKCSEKISMLKRYKSVFKDSESIDISMYESYYYLAHIILKKDNDTVLDENSIVACALREGFKELNLAEEIVMSVIFGFFDNKIRTSHSLVLFLQDSNYQFSKYMNSALEKFRKQERLDKILGKTPNGVSKNNTSITVLNLPNTIYYKLINAHISTIDELNAFIYPYRKLDNLTYEEQDNIRTSLEDYIGSGRYYDCDAFLFDKYKRSITIPDDYFFAKKVLKYTENGLVSIKPLAKEYGVNYMDMIARLKELNIITD